MQFYPIRIKARLRPSSPAASFAGKLKLSTINPEAMERSFLKSGVCGGCRVSRRDNIKSGRRAQISVFN